MEYSPKFKEKMVAKLVGPDALSVGSVSEETGVPKSTLQGWKNAAKMSRMKPQKDRRKSKKWTIEAKTRFVLEAGAVGESELGALLRQEGLYEADLKRMRQEALEAVDQGLLRTSSARSTADNKKIRSLTKELARKEKALAEAAALLVLRKKAEAFFLSEEEGEDIAKRNV
jgi:DNA-binding transcriptional MerR regulator